MSVREPPEVEPSDNSGTLSGGGLTGTRTGGTSVGTSIITTAPSILRAEELGRTRALMRLVALAAAAGLVAIWLPERISPGRMLATIVVGVTFVVTLWLLVEFRDPERYDRRKVLVQGLLCAASILAVAFYVGVFSPAVMALCVGIYFFGLGDSATAGWAVFLACAIGYFALAALAMAGLIHTDQSVLALKQPELASMVATTGVAEVLLLATFWMARQSRRATLGAFDRLEKAARQIKKRDALLDEARADIERAGAALLGRYSGHRLGGFEVIEMIGRGAMGEVYRAREIETDNLVALKFLHPMVLEDPAHLARFLREAEISSALKSEHIVRVSGTGTAPDGAPYMVMELLQGNDLAWHLRQKKRLGVSATLELVRQVADALTAADEAGIVHRDLKPQNLFYAELTSRRVWKVLDFGVSKINDVASTLTQGAAVGTPSYMSPEQARGQEVDHRADVFALGVVAYRAMTGRPAFTAPDSVTTLYNVAHVQPVRPGELVRVTDDVERVLALVLAKERERRFSSASMFALALRDAARQRLDERLRRDADALLEEHPWGTDDLVLRRSA
jgi:serine/threonine-protein kinase